MNNISSLNNVEVQYRRTMGFTLFIAFLSSVGLMVSPGNTTIIGFVVGCLVGVLNANFLVRRMRGLVALALEKNMDQRQAKIYMKAGFYPRLGMIIAVVFLASRISFINLYGMGLGLLLPTLITLVDINVALYKYFAAKNAADRA